VPSSYPYWVPSHNPGHSRGQGRGGSTKLFAVVSFSRSRCGAPLSPAPFRAPRMRTLRGPSRTLKSLHRIVSTSDVPFVARRHSRVGILLRPICCPASRSSRMVMWRLTYEPEDFCFVRPVRAGRASARERLPSYREPASRNPQAMHTETFIETAHTRTVSPSAHPRPASGGAADFFQASALSSPTDLAISWWRRRAMRPTDVCHPNELRAPAPRVFPARSRHFRSGDTPRSLRLRTA